MALLPKVRLKTLVSFPASVIDGTGVDVVKVNGSFRFDLAYDDFAPPVGGIPDPTNQIVLVWHSLTGQYTLVPASVFGVGSGMSLDNPSAVVGLSPVNGVAASALRSDGAPALSQSIVPVWTGKHTFQAGVEVNTAPFLHTLGGYAGDSNVWHSVTGEMSSATLNEGGGQFSMISTAGLGQAIEKVAVTAQVLALATSANIVASQATAYGHGGVGGHAVYGFRANVGNFNLDATTFTANSVYGCSVTSEGTKKATTAYYAGATTASAFQYGITFGTDSIAGTAIHDASNSVSVLTVVGSHTNGIDFTGGVFSGNTFKSTGFAVNAAGGVSSTSTSFTGSTALVGPSIFQNSNILVFCGGTSGYLWDNQALNTQLMGLSDAGIFVLTNVTAATSVSAAAAVFAGGVGVGKTSFFGEAVTINAATSIPAGGTTGAGLRVSSTANFGVFFGSGLPTLSAAKGSLYLRSDGSSTSTRAYVNTDGATAWTSITTAA